MRPTTATGLPSAPTSPPPRRCERGGFRSIARSCAVRCDEPLQLFPRNDQDWGHTAFGDPVCGLAYSVGHLYNALDETRDPVSGPRALDVKVEWGQPAAVARVGPRVAFRRKATFSSRSGHAALESTCRFGGLDLLEYVRGEYEYWPSRPVGVQVVSGFLGCAARRRWLSHRFPFTASLFLRH